MNPVDIQRVLDALRRIVQTLRASSRASEKVAGITTAQVFVLQQVAQDPCSISELAARTYTQPGSVSAVVSRLVAQGLATRTGTGDRRRAEVTCTPEGRARLAEVAPQVQERLIAVMAAMDPATLSQMAVALEFVASSVAAQDEAPPMFFEGEEEGHPPVGGEKRDPE